MAAAKCVMRIRESARVNDCEHKLPGQNLDSFNFKMLGCLRRAAVPKTLNQFE